MILRIAFCRLGAVFSPQCAVDALPEKSEPGDPEHEVRFNKTRSISSNCRRTNSRAAFVITWGLSTAIRKKSRGFGGSSLLRPLSDFNIYEQLWADLHLYLWDCCVGVEWSCQRCHAEKITCQFYSSGCIPGVDARSDARRSSAAQRPSSPGASPRS